MPPLPVITDGFYCAYRFALSESQSAETTFSVSTTDTDPSSIADDLQAVFSSELLDQFSSECKLVSVSVQPLDGVSGATIFPTEAVGGDPDPPTPDSCAFVTTLRTALAGRSNRGRMFWPGQVNNQVNSDRFTWKSTHVSAWQGAIDSWHAGLGTSGFTLGVLSRSLSSFREVTTLTARPLIGTQRRRLKGGLIF
jgi:hypothetical protein